MLSHFTNHLAIKKRITIGFLAIILVLCGVMGYLYKTANESDQKVYAMVENNDRLLIAMGIEGLFQQQRIIAHRFALTNDAKDKTAFLDANKATQDKLNQLLEKTETAQDKTFIDNLLLQKTQYQKGFDSLSNIMNDMTLDEPTRRQKALELLSGDMRNAANAVRESIKTLVTNAEKNFREEEENTHKGMKNIQFSIVASGVISIGLSFLISLLIGASIASPISKISQRMSALAGGDKTSDIPFQSNRDEVGNMARQVEVFRDNAIKVDHMTAEQEELKRAAERERKAGMLKLADDFDLRTKQVVETLVTAATQMKSTAQSMNAGSQATAQASSIVAAAALEADSNVQTVAAAAEELAATSQEIARQISSTAKRTAQASAEAQSTSETVNELNTLALAIGDVVGAIRDIAEQTNLLALNATIEAARAGEAGKGFAVVADEVKKLANETALKTEEISSRVQKIQSAVRTSVDSVARIIEGVQEINQMTGAVAAAVEEQSAATSEIGRNVSEASTGTQQVSVNISEVQKTATEAGESSRQVLQAANDIGDVSSKLKDELTGFLNEIRQA